jgi:hypothetical protein
MKGVPSVLLMSLITEIQIVTIDNQQTYWIPVLLIHIQNRNGAIIHIFIYPVDNGDHDSVQKSIMIGVTTDSLVSTDKPFSSK